MHKYTYREGLHLHELFSPDHKARLRDPRAVADAKLQLEKQSYADITGKHCYLCTKDFDTDADLIKHEILDSEHNNNLLDEDAVNIADAKLKEHGLPLKKRFKIKPQAEYRDRAMERREAFGSSKKVSFTQKKFDKPPKDEPQEAAPAESKGASLLNKMGWKAGEGLGAQGTGMTAAIETNLYAGGVGLGAQGGKLGSAMEEAERNTKGDYREFLERTKDKAKERYEKLV